MTTPGGQISVSDVSSEIGVGATYSSSLNFLNNYVKTAQRPGSPNMDSFRNKAYYQRNADGNCNNGNCTNNCNCGNINCNNCLINGGVNCTNCDGSSQLQSNCNCACTYNCTVCSSVSYNCNCQCNCFWSDDRLKTRKNIIEDALAIVRRLEGFYYKGNDLAVSMGLGNKIDIGVSAQNIKKEFPIALGPNLSNTDLMQVRYERLVPLLIEAIKQLDDKIEQIKK